MTQCSCWCEYPNEHLKRKNGKWKCVDEYKCIRPLRHYRDKGGARKTLCEKKGEQND